MLSRRTPGVVVVLVMACGGPRGQGPTPAPQPAACVAAGAPSIGADSLSVVLTSMVSAASAPRPSTIGEQFVFAQAYETLLRVDCQGRATGGLARTWTALDGNTRWRVMLRSDARFWNGDTVTATDVIASWRATGLAAPAALARHLAEQSVAVDDTTLDISVSSLAIETLGSAELAVVRRTPQSRWPDGTGAYRIVDGGGQRAGSAQRSSLRLEPVGAVGLRRVTVHSTTEADARDLVDAGADLLITPDRALAAYGTARPGFTSSPLESSETWVLLTHALADVDSAAATATERTAATRAALAQNAVRAHARPAGSARWPVSGIRCAGLEPPTAQGVGLQPRGTRIVYQRNEPIGRALAERLVALASSGDAGL